MSILHLAKYDFVQIIGSIRTYFWCVFWRKKIDIALVKCYSITKRHCGAVAFGNCHSDLGCRFPEKMVMI